MWTERRVHLAVIVGCLLLYVPFAGSYGLWDPWETHYAEVARQMLLRGDAIDLVWNGAPNDLEFWSKPPLTFWCEAASMTLFGVDPADTKAITLGSRAEWAVRLPAILFAVLAVWSVFFATSRLLSRRAALFAAGVCASTPLFALIARQAITDMYMVGTLCAAMALAALALFDEERDAGRLRWVAAIGLAVVVGPQLVALARRTPAIETLPYAIVLGGLLFRIARAAKRSQALIHIAYVLAGLCVLAKGAVGVGIALATIGLVILVTRDWRALVRLRPIDGLFTIAVIAIPWHHAMYALHGKDFLIEVMMHNWKRVGSGVYGQRTGSLGYFIRELAYGMLPWIPIAIGALVGALREARRFVLLSLVWVCVAFATVAMSATKFHHYILPVVPPLAILCGWFLDALLRRERLAGARTAMLAFGVPLAVFAALALVSKQQSAEQLFWLFNFDYMLGGQPWPGYELRQLIVGVALVVVIASILIARSARSAAIVAVFAVATFFTVVLLDVVMPRASETWSQKGAIAHFYRVRKPGDRLFAFWIYMRGESFYAGGELFDPAWPRDRNTVFKSGMPGLVAWRRAHPQITTYVLTAFWTDIEHLRRHFPDLRVEHDNTHVQLIALPARQ